MIANIDLRGYCQCKPYVNLRLVGVKFWKYANVTYECPLIENGGFTDKRGLTNYEASANILISP